MGFVKRCILIIGLLTIFQPVCPAQELQKAASLTAEAQALLRSAMTARKNGNLLMARGYLAKIMEHCPEYGQIEAVRKEWGRITFKLIHSDLLSGEAVLYKVLPGDSLEKIAKKHRTTVELIKKRNGLKESNLIEGEELSVWTYPFTIVIDKGTNQLWLMLNNSVVKRYRVSTGKAETVTPLGEFTVKYRYPFPVWYHRGEVVPGGRADNWLGTRWLGFDKPKYGIHGTIYPQLIGKSVSGGCVRMKNEEVEELYDMIPVGTKVTIIDSQAKVKRRGKDE